VSGKGEAVRDEGARRPPHAALVREPDAVQPAQVVAGQQAALQHPLQPGPVDVLRHGRRRPPVLAGEVHRRAQVLVAEPRPGKPGPIVVGAAGAAVAVQGGTEQADGGHGEGRLRDVEGRQHSREPAEQRDLVRRP
jgi:hypothetical protein